MQVSPKKVAHNPSISTLLDRCTTCGTPSKQFPHVDINALINLQYHPTATTLCSLSPTKVVVFRQILSPLKGLLPQASEEKFQKLT